MGKANTKDSYEALLDTMRSSSIVFDVFCGIGDYDNGCKEFIEAYRGNIRSFRAEDTEDQLKSRGLSLIHI